MRGRPPLWRAALRRIAILATLRVPDARLFSALYGRMGDLTASNMKEGMGAGAQFVSKGLEARDCDAFP
jgi:hypothetical protein